jgi:hypothetical protein
MRNRPIRPGGLVSEVGYSSSKCRIQHECQVGVLGRVNGMTATSIPYLLEIERDSLGICLITGDCELDSAEETTRWRSFLSPRLDDHYIQATFLPLLVHNDDNPDSPNRFIGVSTSTPKTPSLNVDRFDYKRSGLEITVV